MRSVHIGSVLVLIIALASAHCGGRDTTTAPTPIVNSPTPPVVVTPPSPPPVVATPAPLPAPNPLLSDPRFDLAFYRQFALNGYERPDALSPLRRHTQAPFIYLMTIDDAGTAIDTGTLNAVAGALESVAGQLTGVFGLEGLQRGPGPAPSRNNVIVVRWWSQSDKDACATAPVGGRVINLYPPVNLGTVRHELGHALGYWHTDSGTDLMYSDWRSGCNAQPSAREIFHARVAYGQPVGSLDPR
jgi:hypothetical protein